MIGLNNFVLNMLTEKKQFIIVSHFLLYPSKNTNHF
jgi:hypothetical protein